MLSVYTFVFSVVFKAKWSTSNVQSESNQAIFAIMLFVGLIIHGIFAEVLNKAPSLIISNSNYVKKVIFPLEILPFISMGTAFFHAIISTVVLLVAQTIFIGLPPITAFLIPIIFIPLMILTIGLALFLASIGTYLRDVAQTIGIVTTIMLFLSPVFFPISALPKEFQPFILANPLTFIIEQARLVLVEGILPDFLGLLVYFISALAVAWFGYAWFQITRKGFSDVL